MLASVVLTLGMLTDAGGQSHRPADWSRNSATVFFFTTTDCPVGNNYVPEMNRLANAYGSRGVRFFAVQADVTVPAEQVRKHAGEFAYGFPVLLDPAQSLVRAIGATVTPEVAVLSPSGELKYLGRIDNRVEDFGKKRPEATQFDLREALDAVLAGKPVAQPRTKAVGCAISAHRTFNRDVAPLLHAHCAGCHRPGEVAPFSLLTYSDAAKRAGLITALTQSRFMPPWKAEPGIHRFKGDRRLSDEQIAVIRDWAANGSLEGDAADRPAPPTFPEGWQAGQPDRVFTMLTDHRLPADGPDQLQCFVIPMDSGKESYITSFEFRPGNRRIVHHAEFFIDPSRTARKKAGSAGTYSCFGSPGFSPAVVLGGWAPGGGPDALEAGQAITVPKGADLVLRLHYHPSGKPETDRSSVGLKFGERPRVALSQVLLASKLDIPPGAPRYVVKTGIRIPADVDLLTIGPHAHYLGKEMKVWARLPGGAAMPLIEIGEWDFNWQILYRYEQPVRLPKGTRVEIEFSYDNSTKNPRNPSRPPRRVHAGEQTTDEMAVLYLNLALPGGATDADFQKALAVEYVDQYLEQDLDPKYLYPFVGLSAELRAWLVTAVPAYDFNHNGKLSLRERQALLAALRKRIGLNSN